MGPARNRTLYGLSAAVRDETRRPRKDVFAGKERDARKARATYRIRLLDLALPSQGERSEALAAPEEKGGEGTQPRSARKERRVDALVDEERREYGGQCHMERGGSAARERTGAGESSHPERKCAGEEETPPKVADCAASSRGRAGRRSARLRVKRHRRGRGTSPEGNAEPRQFRGAPRRRHRLRDQSRHPLRSETSLRQTGAARRAPGEPSASHPSQRTYASALWRQSGDALRRRAARAGRLTRVVGPR